MKGKIKILKYILQQYVHIPYFYHLKAFFKMVLVKISHQHMLAK